MGCGASKVSNQTLTPVESEVQNEAVPKAINNVLSSSPQTTSTTSLTKTQNITNNDSKNESDTSNENKITSTSSSDAKEQEVNLRLKKSSSATLGLEKPKSNSIFKSKSKSSLLESTDNNNNNQKTNDSLQYHKTKEISSSNIISNKYGKIIFIKKYRLYDDKTNGKLGLSQSSSEATLTNQNSSDSIGKLSLTSCKCHISIYILKRRN